MIRSRNLQTANNFTSPPTKAAMAATPLLYRGDEFIVNARNLSSLNLCSDDSYESRCHIAFAPSKDWSTSRVGIIFHGAARVDPRSYSPLMDLISDRYGIPGVVTIFESDLTLRTGACRTFRLRLAKTEFPEVEKWIFAGHALGGVAAANDVWANKFGPNSSDTADSVGGLVLLAADVQSIGCGVVDFLGTGFPLAMVTASEDQILNRTRFAANRRLASNQTFFVDIFGGNHDQFSSFNASLRFENLGRQDGTPKILPEVQWDLTAAAIYNVAARTNATLPRRVDKVDGDSTSGASGTSTAECPPESGPSFTSAGTTSGLFSQNSTATMLLTLLLLWLKKRL
mgnify:CR=1 FL=1